MPANSDRLDPATFTKTPSFIEATSESVIREYVFPLLSVKGEDCKASGTCVVIAPQVALTARHVVEDYIEEHEGFLPSEGAHEGTFMLWAYQAQRGGTDGALWNVSKFWTSAHTDIAVLLLVPASELASTHKLPGSVVLSFPPPEVGERVACFGYHDSRASLTISGNSVEIEWDDRGSTSIGEVVQVFEKRRDRGRLKWPSFQVNARFKPSMSGGPVFNERGHLCGVICQSLKELEEDEADAVSYVSTLWPLVATELDIPRADGVATPYTIYSAAQAGFFKSWGIERVGVERDAETGKVTPILRRTPGANRATG